MLRGRVETKLAWMTVQTRKRAVGCAKGLLAMPPAAARVAVEARPLHKEQEHLNAGSNYTHLLNSSCEICAAAATTTAIAIFDLPHRR